MNLSQGQETFAECVPGPLNPTLVNTFDCYDLKKILSFLIFIWHQVLLVKIALKATLLVPGIGAWYPFLSKLFSSSWVLSVMYVRNRRTKYSVDILNWWFYQRATHEKFCFWFNVNLCTMLYLPYSLMKKEKKKYNLINIPSKCGV